MLSFVSMKMALMKLNMMSPSMKWTDPSKINVHARPAAFTSSQLTSSNMIGRWTAATETFC